MVGGVDVETTKAAVCDEGAGRKQESTCPTGASAARSVLEKLARLSLTNRLTDDQATAVVALGDQLFQTSSLTPTPAPAAVYRCASPTDRPLPCDPPQPSQASLLADAVVGQTVSRIRAELTADGAAAARRSTASMLADTVVQRTISRIRGELDADDGAAAVQRRSTASMLADTVVQETLKEISDDLMTSDLLRPATTSDRSVKVASSTSTTGACPPAICTELTKYIVMNAVDIALSCSRRAAAKRAATDAEGSRDVPADRRTPGSSLIDAFVDQLSSEVYGSLDDAAARRPTPEAVIAASRWIDDDLRHQCLHATSTPHHPPGESGVNPFAEVLMNLAIHDRLGDLQKNFVDGREMIELATCVLKSHVQSRSSAHHPPGHLRKTITWFYHVMHVM